MFSDGQLFHLNDSITGFEEAPVGSGNSINFKGRLWAGGIISNSLVGAVQFTPGPLDTLTGLPDTTNNFYDKVWRINRSMIDYFQLVYASNPQLIPDDIMYWPAHGGGNYTQQLAPFVDLNNNGIYEPLFGEYPELTGDEMVYWIFNDHGLDSMSCQPLNIEIHGTAYAYVCDNVDPNSNDDAINNTVFYKYTFYKRGLDTITDFYVGWWQNPNLGNGSDDYIGCDTMRNAAFIYNGDNNDSLGYGLNPPMQSYVQLDGPIAPSNDGVDNNHNSFIDEPNEKVLFSGFMTYENNFSIIGTPENCQHIFNYLRIRIKDNVPFVNNGTNGYGSGIPTRYLYSGIPYSGQPWTEETAGNSPSNRYFLMSCGGTNLYPNQPITYEYAIIFSHYADAPNGANTSFALNNAYVDKITDWYNAQSFPSCYDPTPVAEIQADNSKLIVYPNPATNQLNILMDFDIDAVVEVYNLQGQCVAKQQILAGSQNPEINISNFNNGIYLIRVNTPTQILLNERLLIAK